jgi:hypothetical protein
LSRNNNQPYDVIVIGGGPSGLMASVAASEHDARVLLLDKGDKLGRKLGISGGGRCNVTNNKPLDELIRNIPGNGRFLHSSLTAFGNREIIRFFEELGIRLKEEDRGRMFPVSDKAKTVVEALIRKVRELGVDIRTNAPVERIIYDFEHRRVKAVKLRNGETIPARCVIVAVGGKSVPHTGSTGDGYPWAEAAGHTITELYPTEVPITSDEPFIVGRELQGLSLRNIELTVWSPNGKRIVTHEGDMIFTHFGISGPAALRCSQFVVKALKQHGGCRVLLTIDLMPDRTQDEILPMIVQAAKREPKKTIKNVLKPFLPDRLIPLLLAMAELPPETTSDQLPKKPLQALARTIKQFPLHADGTRPIEEAFVTGGGVNLKEIDPRTMQSKLMEGLYFCGEILDVHGYTGGYNITAAFSTGHTAGKHAALASLDSPVGLR